MRPHHATFVISAAEPTGFPPGRAPEVAFVGRSNVGKSSLINDLTGHGGLARTSRTPGRTRLINWFEVAITKSRVLHFVDLPGYGYAEVGVEMRKRWRPLIEAYLERPNLAVVVLLLDARRDVGPDELDFMAWLAERKLQAIVVVTKADKLSKHERVPAAAKLRRDLNLTRAPILYSTLDHLGHDQLWRAIQATTTPA